MTLNSSISFKKQLKFNLLRGLFRLAEKGHFRIATTALNTKKLLFVVITKKAKRTLSA